MSYAEIVDVLAPCGLNCSRCLARDGGAIQQTSAHLLELLDGFEKHHKRFAAMEPVFENYPGFAAVAEYFAKGSCGGCRKGECLHTGCGIQSCYRAMDVDFCFQCDEFPCTQHGLDPALEKIWVARNMRMKEIGVERFHEESLKRPRY